MKVTRQVTSLTGFNESPVGGDFIVSSNRDFIDRRVVVGVSILYNRTKNLQAIVTAVTTSQIDATGTNFSSGDFFEVSLATPWTVQNADLPDVDVECNRCGWSYPSKDLQNGLCKWCIDQPRSK